MGTFEDRIKRIRNALAGVHEYKLGSKEYRMEHPEYAAKVDEAYRRWRADNLERSNKYHREYRRRNYISITREGKQVSVRLKGKRPWPGSCELCDRNNCVLYYHHWDDGNLSKGLWLCMMCHGLAEAMDDGAKVEKYLNLKRQITGSSEVGRQHEGQRAA